MKLIPLILFTIFFNSFTILGQETTLSGKIVNGEGLGLEFINVLNRTHIYGTISNANGEFSFPVYRGDTLVFSSVHFKNKTIIVNDSLLDNSELIIELTEELFKLNDVVLTGGFSMLDTTNKEFGEIDMGLPFNTKPVVRSYSERKKNYLKSNTFTSILNRLNGNLEQMERLEEVEREFALADNLYERLDSTFYIKIGVPGDQIYNFIDYYMKGAKQRGLLRTGRHYELVDYIQSKVVLFLEKSKLNIDSIHVR